MKSRTLCVYAMGTMVIIFIVAFASVLQGEEIAREGIARDCQKHTYFWVEGVKFECMEWKNDN